MPTFLKVLATRQLELKQYLSKQLPRDIGSMAVTHFVQNFRREGYYNESGAFVKWARRKREEKGARRAVLTKRGHLKNSIRVVSKTPDKVVIGTSKPYARVHNEGGRISIPASQRIVRLRTDGKGKFLRQSDLVYGPSKRGSSNLAVFAKKGHKRVTEAKVNVKAHTIAMPQRRFMGASKQLHHQIKGEIARNIRTILTVK